MAKDKNDSVSGVGKTTSVKKTTAVTGVESVEETSGIDKVKSVGAVRGVGQAGRVLAASDREKLFSMIDEEAKKIFPESSISAKQRDIISKAVKMAIDSGLREEEPAADKKKK